MNKLSRKRRAATKTRIEQLEMLVKEREETARDFMRVYENLLDLHMGLIDDKVRLSRQVVDLQRALGAAMCDNNAFGTGPQRDTCQFAGKECDSRQPCGDCEIYKPPTGPDGQ